MLSFRVVNRALLGFAAAVSVIGLSALPAQNAAAPSQDSDTPPAQASEPVAGEMPEDQYFELFREFVDAFEQVDRNYVKEVDRKELMHAAIQGMLFELDPYSTYIPPDDLADFTQGIEQEFGGVGIQVQLHPETRRLTVVTPLPGTPAYRAGVLAGDVIMEIEGESTEGFTIEDAVERLKGKPGEAVTIGVLHRGKEETEQVKLVREIIHVATVLGDQYESDGTWDYMLDEETGIGYVRLTHFSRRTSEELQAAIEQLKKQDMKGLVLDLRFNPGGLLSEAIKICDLFLDEGTIVSTKGRNVPDRSWEAYKPGTFDEFPVAIVVNRYSASASEIVSACLQDHHRAVIVGERTWGKGSVQNVIDLGSGESALKLTTASYLRPSGKNIHRFPDSNEEDEWGVKPDADYATRFTDEEMLAYLRYRRNRDVLGNKEEATFQDRQLERAVSYVREQITGKPSEPADETKKDAVEAPKTGSIRRASPRNIIAT